MVTTFKEVSETKTVDFCSLAAGDCFYYGNTYYMKLIEVYETIEEDSFDDNYCYNSVDIKCGVLSYFSPKARVKSYKKCEVILHE